MSHWPDFNEIWFCPDIDSIKYSALNLIIMLVIFIKSLYYRFETVYFWNMGLYYNMSLIKYAPSKCYNSVLITRW